MRRLQDLNMIHEMLNISLGWGTQLQAAASPQMLRARQLRRYLNQEMKIILQSKNSIELNKFSDLARVIPTGCTGEPLNFGQGEGQVKIENTVWGFYAHSKERYYMQYEEGSESWLSVQNLAYKIHKQLSREFETEIELIIEGVFQGGEKV